MPKPQITLFNLVITPTQCYQGHVVKISCLATNATNNKNLQRTIKLTIGGVVVATQSITLNPGQSMTVTFNQMAGLPKTYAVMVDGLSGQFTVIPVPVANIVLSNLKITGPAAHPTIIYPNDPVTITVDAINTGTITGSKTITLTVS